MRQQDFRGLETLARLSGDRFVRGVVLCTGTTVVPCERNLFALPVSQREARSSARPPPGYGRQM